ncbi:MAG TPA: PAS domain S-box protein [Holophagaceae bacterium]|nr:PAS domain S-box protein [Holophagaceae bacterium]
MGNLQAFLPRRRQGWLVAGYLLAFFLLELITRGFRQSTGVNLWFPPPALTLALVLAFGEPVLWATFLGHLPYGLLFSPHHLGFLSVVGISFAHGIAYGLPALLARRLGMGTRLDRFGNLGGFLALTLVGSALLAAQLTPILNSGPGAPGPAWPILSSLWLGDAMGVLCLAPFLLTWGLPVIRDQEPAPPSDLNPVRMAEALAQALVLVAVAIGVMLHQQGQAFPLKYLALIPLLWIALRWGSRGAAAACLGFALVSLAAFLALDYTPTLIRDLQYFFAMLLPLTLLVGTLADVRRRAERELAGQTTRLASILRATGAFPFELDRVSGRTLAMDDHLTASLETTAEEWNAAPHWGALLPPTDRERFRGFCEGNLQGSLDLRFRMGGGGERFLQVVAGARTGSRISGILVDVHERKEAQRRLEASEALYRATVESLDEGVVVRDLAGRVRSMNESARRILGGLPHGNSTGPEDVEPVDEEGHLIPWEDQPPMIALRKRIAIHSVMGLRKRNGEVRWITVRSRPLWNGTELQGVVSSTLDVTEERNAAAELRASEARYRRLVEQSLIPMAIHQDGRFVYLNEATVRLFGAEGAEELLKRSVVESIHPDDREDSIQRLQALARGEVDVLPTTERRILTLDGRELIVELLVLGTRYGGRPAVQVMAVDVTARKAMESGLQASLKEKDLAIREIHHRVKNNLQVVSSLLRLQAQSSRNPEVTRALTEAQERVQAIALIHGRLHQAPALAEADLRDYLTRLVGQLVRTYATVPSLVDATVTVGELSLGPDELVPLALILHELVLNALQHGFAAGEGGALGVALTSNAEGHVTLRVEDDGHGLPEGLDLDHDGGLGFQLVKALADQLKGTLQITRRKGAAFQLTFTPRTP